MYDINKIMLRNGIILQRYFLLKIKASINKSFILFFDDFYPLNLKRKLIHLSKFQNCTTDCKCVYSVRTLWTNYEGIHIWCYLKSRCCLLYVFILQSNQMNEWMYFERLYDILNLNCTCVFIRIHVYDILLSLWYLSND